MIIKNHASEIGDVLRIETDTPLIGLIALLSFVDDTEGEYVDRSFKKSFRYSVDGVTWTQFVPLTNDNIAGVQVQANDYFYAEYLYERVGTDASDDLVFNSVTLNGQYVTPTDGPAYLASNFNNYFNLNNICSIAWSVNVLEKLYKKGIIPEFIERNLSGDNTTDRDYLDFWRGITHYFALYVCLARQFQFFYQNRDLLLEFVKQHGLLVCEDIEFIDLIYLMEYYYDEIRQRGTRQVFITKATDITIAGSKQVDGEYLRLICYDLRDEFLRNLNQNKHIGWNISNSSPLYKGLEDRLNVNKYYIDYISDIVNIKNDLSLVDSSLPYISIHSTSESNSSSKSESRSGSGDMDDADAVIISNPGNGNSAGIGGGDRRIVVNPNLDYEITFFIKANNAKTQPITFGVNGYNKNGYLSDFMNIDNGGSNSIFFTQQQLNKKDTYYFVRGIIYNKRSWKNYSNSQIYQVGDIINYLGEYYRAKRIVPVNGTVTSLGVVQATPGSNTGSPILWDFWQHLTFNEVQFFFTTNLGIGKTLSFNDGIVEIDPFILYDNNNSSTEDLYLYDLRVQPLSTPYSKGFLGTSNFLEVWATNNNLNQSNDSVERNTKKFLIPYNTTLKTNFIPTEVNK